MTDERYVRSLPALSENDIHILHGKKVLVAGLGGLGGYIAETLARVGVLSLTIADNDCFERSNLNRQRFADERNSGVLKTEAAKRALAAINSQACIRTIAEKLETDNTSGLIAGHDVVVDALDSVAAKLMLADACAALNMPLVHGAVGGWFGQVMTICPGDEPLRLLYRYSDDTEAGGGALPFVVSNVAALQSAEVVKLLTGRGELLRGAFLRLDMLTNEYTVIPLKSGEII